MPVAAGGAGAGGGGGERHPAWAECFRVRPPWFTNGYGRPAARDLAANFRFLSNRIDVVYWSLSVELAASAVFVPLVYVVRRFGVAAQAGLLMALVAISYVSFGPYWARAQHRAMVL